MVSPSSNPISGDSTMNMPMVRNPVDFSTCVPDRTTAAPAMPPTNACDDDVGSPSQNVIRFQPMAPTNPAKTTPIVSTCWSTTSLAMVLATCVLNTRKATKLKNAAHSTAHRGDSTRVDTTVAIELAASWNPFV